MSGNLPESQSSAGTGMSTADPANQRKELKLKPVTKRILREEIVEDLEYVEETVVEYVNKIVQEKVVEVPDVEYKESLKEVVNRKIEEKVREIPRVEYVERVIEIPKYKTCDKYITVPQIEYRDVITERNIEIPEIHQNVVIKEVVVPQYVDNNGNPVQRPIIEIERKIPIPVEAVTTYEYQLSEFRPRPRKVKYPLYLPRLIPVPVVAESLKPGKLIETQQVEQAVANVTSMPGASLKDVDDLVNTIKRYDVAQNLPTVEEAHEAIREKWLSGQLYIVNTNPSSEIPQAC